MDRKNVNQESFHGLFQRKDRKEKKELRDPPMEMFPPTTARKGGKALDFPSLPI